MNETPLTPKTFRATTVIGILPGNPPSPCLREARVQGANQPPVLVQRDQPDTGIMEPLDNFSGTVCGTVIHHEDFKILELLGEKIAQGPMNVTPRIIDRQQDTEERVAHDFRI
jgi:hypothetical protein